MKRSQQGFRNINELYFRGFEQNPGGSEPFMDFLGIISCLIGKQNQLNVSILEFRFLVNLNTKCFSKFL